MGEYIEQRENEIKFSVFNEASCDDCAKKIHEGFSKYWKDLPFVDMSKPPYI